MPRKRTRARPASSRTVPVAEVSSHRISRTATSGWTPTSGTRSSAVRSGLAPARAQDAPDFRAPQCGHRTTTARSGAVTSSVRSAAHSAQTPSVSARPVAPQTTQNSSDIGRPR